MKQQTAFAIACGLTAFLLVGGGAVFTSWRDGAAAADATAAAPAIIQTAAPDTTAQERAVFQAREAVYQQRIAEANRRLAQSATVVAAEAATVTAADENTRAAANAAPQTARIPVMQAARIAVIEALAHSADAQPQRAELVNFQGAVAYEITLNNGVVYVDAASGAILGSQWAERPANATLEAAAPQRRPVVEAPAPTVTEEQQEEGEHDDD